MINNGHPISGRAADTYNTLLANDTVLLSRKDFGTAGGWREIRGFRRMVLKPESSRWEEESSWYLDRNGKKEITEQQIYALTGTEYSGVLLGLASVIKYPRDISEGGIDTSRQHERDVVRMYLASSHDEGKTWDLGAVYSNSTLVATGSVGGFIATGTPRSIASMTLKMKERRILPRRSVLPRRAFALIP